MGYFGQTRVSRYLTLPSTARDALALCIATELNLSIKAGASRCRVRKTDVPV